jgi:methylase of polypeptide subunit release factors
LLFDLIVANLPYIPSRRIKNLPSSVKDFEPHLALDGGKGGVESINRLIAQLPRYLKPEGVAILEIDDTHTLRKFKTPPASPEAVRGRANSKFKMEIKKDRFGRNRFLILQFG